MFSRGWVLFMVGLAFLWGPLSAATQTVPRPEAGLFQAGRAPYVFPQIPAGRSGGRQEYIPRWTPSPRVAGDELWADGFGLPALDGIVECSAIWNGSLVIGGQFTQVCGVPASNVALWDGNRWMPLGTGLNEEVLSLLVFNGDLVASGRFTGSGLTEASGVATWNGTSWQAMGAGFDLGPSNLPTVAALAVYRDELIAAGEFTRSGATPLRSIARWDGTSWNPLGEGLNGRVLALASLGYSLYAGGLFDSAGAEQASSFAR